MQNNIFNKFNVSSRIICLLILILIILFANSLYLLLFLLIFTVLILMLTDESVNVYIDFIKNVKFILLFIFIGYIIIFGKIVASLIFTCKIILIFLHVKQFTLTTNMHCLINGIKTLLKPLRKFININDFSYNIGLFILFINTYLESEEVILNRYNESRYRYIFSLKRNILPRIYYTTNKINEKEESMRLKFYKTKEEIVNKQSKLIIIVFSLLFVVVMFKEVIL